MASSSKARASGWGAGGGFCGPYTFRPDPLHGHAWASFIARACGIGLRRDHVTARRIISARRHMICSWSSRWARSAASAAGISSATTRELRASVELATGGFVADRVPFQLSPNATRWNEVRSGAVGPHWSDAARAANPLEFVILVTSAGAVGADILFANGDAAAPATRFAAGDAGTALLRSTYALDPELLDAEVLAAAPVPFSSITLVGVANEPVRDQVRQLLADVGGAAPKVAVYPPWFQGE